VNFGSKVTLVTKLVANKKFRDAYVYEHVRNGVPFQIRTLREERGWTQGKLGEVSAKPRNVITRLEDPNYGKFTLKTLLEIASAFDVAVLIKFVPFSRLLREYDDTSPSALGAPSILEETRRLTRWARTKDAPNASAQGPESPQLTLPWNEWINLTTVAGDRSINILQFRSRQGSAPTPRLAPEVNYSYDDRLMGVAGQ